MELKGKVALITGGATGIGRSTALRLAKDGADICICYSRSEDEAKKTCAEVEALGVRCEAYRASVSDDAKVKDMVKQILARFGRLDVLVNCAGTTHFVKHDDLEGMTAEFFDDIFDVNVKGTFFVCRAAAQALKADGGGVIVNIASMAGVNGTGSCIAYAASKAAEIAMTKSLARVMAPEVRVLSVAPGIVMTRWVAGQEEHVARLAADTLLKRVAGPDDIAQSVYGLIACNDFVTGQNLIIDGGAFL